MEFFQGRGGTQLPGLAHTMGLNAVDQATRDTGRRASIDQRKADFEQRAADEADAKRWHEQHVRDVGTGAVDTEMDKALTEQSVARMQAANARRATAGRTGQAAVRDALSPANIRQMIAAMQQAAQTAWTPEESAGMAQALGHSAVEGALGRTAPAPYPATSPPSAYTTGLLAIPPEQGSAMPMTPPGQTFGPQSVVNPETESTQGTGYAPGSARAAHYGLDAVRRELLDKEPE